MTFFKSIKRMLSKHLKKIFVRYLWNIDAVNGIDVADKKSVTAIPEVLNNVIISGWFFDAKEDDTIAEFFLEIDGNIHRSLYGLIRTDVSFEFKEKRLRNSGFRCVISRDLFQRGRIYNVNIRIKTRQDKVKTIRTAVRFAIDAEKAKLIPSNSNEQLEYSQYLGELLALQYIKGTGIEIGALHAPLSVDNRKAQVLYVDRMSQQDLYEQYPEFKKYDIVAADIIDNGDELSTVPDNSYDFCISNHVLEHLEDPLKALYNWMRILKDKGLLYLSVPLPHNIVDKHREPTSIAHIIEDYGLQTKDREHYLQLRHDHFLDFVRSTNFSQSANEAFINTKTRELVAMDYSIHFHVFSQETLARMIDIVMEKMPLRVIEFVRNEPEEFILILEKQALS